MSEQREEPGGLQFDRVEPAASGDSTAVDDSVAVGDAAGLLCGGCQKDILDLYYEINGGVTCESCHDLLLAARESGSSGGRFARASAYGLLAGALGCGIYYAILKLTGYEVGLISILVGFMVGAAVRVGSNQRGGWVYQALAVAITYVAIVGSYVPMLFAEFENMEQQAAESTAAESTAAESTAADTAPAEVGALPTDVLPEPEPSDAVSSEEGPEASAVETSEPGPGDSATTQPGQAPVVAETSAERGDDLEDMDALTMIMGSLFLIAFVLALPFLAGLENFLGLLIIGFGLWQAWSMNRKEPFDAAGPFRLDERPA